LKLAGGYWSAPTRRQAWLLTVAIIALVVTNIAVQYGANHRNRFFFNALEQHQSNIVLSAIGLFAVLAVASSAISSPHEFTHCASF